MGRENYPIRLAENVPYEWGKAQLLSKGNDVVILGSGPLLGAAIEAGRATRSALNRELADALGEDRLHAAAKTLKDALAARGAMSEVTSRRVRSAQGLA